MDGFLVIAQTAGGEVMARRGGGGVPPAAAAGVAVVLARTLARIRNDLGVVPRGTHASTCNGRPLRVWRVVQPSTTGRTRNAPGHRGEPRGRATHLPAPVTTWVVPRGTPASTRNAPKPRTPKE
jgi:hypothetical protein